MESDPINSLCLKALQRKKPNRVDPIYYYPIYFVKTKSKLTPLNNITFREFIQPLIFKGHAHFHISNYLC